MEKDVCVWKETGRRMSKMMVEVDIECQKPLTGHKFTVYKINEMTECPYCNRKIIYFYRGEDV